LRSGDEIIVTNQDHEANIGCWERLGECGAVVKQWSIDAASGELSVGALRQLVTDRTRLVCYTLCSNIVGSFQEVQAITDIARQVGAITIADGVSYAPHRIVDVTRLGPDVYLFSTYKTYGTHVGVMWIREELFDVLTCQGHYFNSQNPRCRMNPTGPQHAEIAALAGIGQYYDALYQHHFGTAGLSRIQRAQRVFELIAEHETELANLLLSALRELPGVRIIGQSHATPTLRAPTISFVADKMASSQLARELAARKIAVRNGSFYARRCVEALGIEDPQEGVVRVSMAHYNTPDEVRRLTHSLFELLG
jgi:selenocysteine lyase/cysteine desulfurase